MTTQSWVRTLTVLTSMLVVVGCIRFNMPTPPAQITGTYTPGLKYEAFDCSRLLIEFYMLAKRENQLEIDQHQRIEDSLWLAFWWGVGKGDGIAASELATVRGEKEAARRMLEAKGCPIHASGK